MRLVATAVVALASITSTLFIAPKPALAWGEFGHLTVCDLAVVRDKSKPDEDRVFALMAVGHWIGDIHKPLHVSFADDKGGNATKTNVPDGWGTSICRPRNLHVVWNGYLLEAGLFEKVRNRADFNSMWGRRTITYRAVDTLLANTRLADEQQMVGTDPAVWADKSFQVTLQP